MNHNQDIDDGLDEYQEALHRQKDEAAFARMPFLFTGDLGQIGDGDPFICARVTLLHLNGGLRDSKGTPFSYEGGYAVLEGSLKRGGPVLVKMRWALGEFDEVTIETVA